MIYRLEFEYGVGFGDVLRQEEDFMAALVGALTAAKFAGHLCWPRGADESVALIVDGDGDPARLESEIRERIEAAGIESPAQFRIEELGGSPSELAGASSEERSLAIVIMAVPPQSETCHRCDARLPPHESWCPWDLGRWGREVEPDSGGDWGHSGPEDLALDVEERTLDVISEDEVASMQEVRRLADPVA